MRRTLLTLLSITCIAMTVQSQTIWEDKVIIDNNTGNNPYAITSGFIDNDGFLDLLVGTDADHILVWYKGNGDGTFVKQATIPNTLQNIGIVKLADLNGDGTNDIVTTGFGSYGAGFGSNSTMVWFANDGSGNFGAEQIITDTFDGMSGLYIGTVDSGTTLDVVVASGVSNQVLWFSNDGAGNFGAANVIDNTLSSPGVIDMKDIDNDGDLDALVATAAYGGDVIEIFRNDLVPGGSVAFTKDPNTVASGKAGIFSAIFTDLDGDTNLDILATEISFGGGPTGNLFWYEDNGSGFTETAFTTSTNNPAIARAKDLDNDGFDDIIVSSGAASDVIDLVWFKNNGDGTFGSEQVINDTQAQVYVYDVADYDDDGDLDIASNEYNADNLSYVENLFETLNTTAFTLKEIKIFPNPTKDVLNFEGFNTPSIDISVFDILGKRVLEKSINIGDSLDVSELNDGVYTIEVNNNVTTKFIKN